MELNNVSNGDLQKINTESSTTTAIGSPSKFRRSIQDVKGNDLNDLLHTSQSPHRSQSYFGASIKKRIQVVKGGATRFGLARSKSSGWKAAQIHNNGFSSKSKKEKLNSDSHYKKGANLRSRSLSVSLSSSFRNRATSFPENGHEHRPLLVVPPDKHEGWSQFIDMPVNLSPENEDPEDGSVSMVLQEGTSMTKVSSKKKKPIMFRIDADGGSIVWFSTKPHIVAIENIKELRFGSDARYYREQFQLSSEYENKWLTIIYVAEMRYKSLHLIANTEAITRTCFVTLQKLLDTHQELMSGVGNAEKRQVIWEKRYWKGADDAGSQKLNFDEVVSMCTRLNIHFSKDDLKKHFQEADTQNLGYLDFTGFQQFVKLLKFRPELQRLYHRISSANAGRFDFKAFQRFMIKDQKSFLSDNEFAKIFKKYATKAEVSQFNEEPQIAHTLPESLLREEVDSEAEISISILRSSLPEDTSLSTSSAVEGLIMTLDDFTSFLLSADNSVFSDQHDNTWQDMSRPLSEYYISSSHNTYLVGHQLVGISTIEGYIRALLHSCRSVELDIYDGDVAPVVYHGKTLTTKVPLRDACDAIAKYAFVASPYPIIISAEIHCSVYQQDFIADIMQAAFGDSLISDTLDGRSQIDVLPSPEELKGKILLKAKNLYVSETEGLRVNSLSVGLESSTDASASASDSELFQDAKDTINREFKVLRSSEAVKELKEEFQKARGIVNRLSFGSASTNSGSNSPRHFSIQLPLTSVEHSEQAKVKMSKKLASLLVYTVGVKCRGFNKKEHYAIEHVFSLSERTANKVLKQSMMEFIKHNRDHLARIYPNGTRLNSSNFEPHKYWSAGVQLVAINWQTFDQGYMINHAMFQRNGRSGYVLKPLALRVPIKHILGRNTKHSFDVTIISAQQLPRRKDSLGREILHSSTMDPYVEVTLFIPDWANIHQSLITPALYTPALRSTTTSSPKPVSQKTRVVRNNGFNPVWDELLRLPFDCVGGLLDLVFVKFAVMNEGEVDPLAVYCISLGSCLEGHRHLPLQDSHLAQYLFSTLFVHIKIRDN